MPGKRTGVQLKSKKPKKPLRKPSKRQQKVLDEHFGPSLEEGIGMYLSRIGTPERGKYVQELLRDMIANRCIPVELLEHVPVRPRLVGKTRFDQMYDAAMAVAFPEYSSRVRTSLTGNEKDEKMKAWRVILPEKYGIGHAIVRATSFQEAFALGCDYACRVSLRIFRVVPSDLTVRVSFMNDLSLKRFFDIRSLNCAKKRREKKVGKDRIFTRKQVLGAWLCALGHKKGSESHSIAKYVEVDDLSRIASGMGLTRMSPVVTEHTPRDPWAEAREETKPAGCNVKP